MFLAHFAFWPCIFTWIISLSKSCFTFLVCWGTLFYSPLPDILTFLAHLPCSTRIALLPYLAEICQKSIAPLLLCLAPLQHLVGLFLSLALFLFWIIALTYSSLNFKALCCCLAQKKLGMLLWILYVALCLSLFAVKLAWIYPLPCTYVLPFALLLT